MTKGEKQVITQLAGDIYQMRRLFRYIDHVHELDQQTCAYEDAKLILVDMEKILLPLFQQIHKDMTKGQPLP